MAISVDALSSPRVITVIGPDVAITIQELVDQVRDWEDEVGNTEFPHLVKASGKEFLGGTAYVGITAELQNARLAFEARPGPTYSQCTISGGNLVAVDSAGAPIMAIHPTAFTQVVLSQSASPTLVVAGAAAVWEDPRALTVGKFVALK